MKKLFGTDGVRGLAGKKLDAMTAMRLAMAAGVHFRKHAITDKILVGKDTRRSGYMIENAIVAGLVAVGYDAVQIGPMPTPAIAFLTEDMRCDAGIMISASHNPFEDNGIKFFDANGNKLGQDDELAIEELFFSSGENDLVLAAQKTGENIGSAKRIDDVIGRYIVHIKNSFPKHLTLRGLRVVLDTANGAAYKVAPTVFSELGAEVVVINNKPNGFNINDNCGALHPSLLASEVKRLRADIGFAFDGDADRLVVVDDAGSVVCGDALLGILAEQAQKSGILKNNKIVATVMSNGALDEYLKSHKIEVLRSPVGDKNVLEMMRANGCNFGGEQSGHIIFSDFAKSGDGVVSALQMSACLLEKNRKSSEIFSSLKPYPQKLVNVRVEVKKDFSEIDGLSELEQSCKKAKIRTLFRYSGTENVVRLLMEGKDENLLAQKMQEAREIFVKALG